MSTLDPETAHYWYEQLGVPPRLSTPRWAAGRTARSARRRARI
ncbi:MAG TPA: hypothetical protein PKY50_16865 [Candidatus Competibacter sp.]|nr:hypothetical protein [Candidatus Competibacter sp.]